MGVENNCDSILGFVSMYNSCLLIQVHERFLQSTDNHDHLRRPAKEFFDHLPRYELEVNSASGDLHPAIDTSRDNSNEATGFIGYNVNHEYGDSFSEDSAMIDPENGNVNDTAEISLGRNPNAAIMEIFRM